MSGLEALGIDLQSIIYYLVNYGILLGFLGFYVYPKIHKIMEKRQNEITASVNDASKLKQELAKELDQFQEKHEAILAEAREQKKKGLKEIEAAKAAMIEEMEQKKTQSLQETSEMIEQKKAGLLDDAKKEIYLLIKNSFHSVSKKIPEKVVQESIDEAWNELSKAK